MGAPVIFLTSGTWTPGPGVNFAVVFGFGGGGAGGGGAAGGSTGFAGGGGGGGALADTLVIAVTPGVPVNVAIGAGGLSNSPGVGPGGSGGDTTLSQTGVTLATFAGASGGEAGSVTPLVGFGGSPVRGVLGNPNALVNNQYNASNPTTSGSSIPAAGGNGGITASTTVTGPTAGFGMAQTANIGSGATWPGGPGGNNGTSTATFAGGGGGGGGGAGPMGGGPGTNSGGVGGNGTNGGTGGAGSAGQTAGANTGAGGGGGGAGGNGPGGGGAAAVGGNGGSGYCEIIPM